MTISGPTKRDVEKRLDDLEAEQKADHYPPAARAALAAVKAPLDGNSDSLLLLDSPVEAVRKAAPDQSPADVPEEYAEAVETPRRRWFIPTDCVPADHVDALPVATSEEPFLVADFTATDT